MPISFNEVNEKARGGTELMARRLEATFDEKFLEKFQIIPSRMRELMDDKIRIFWCHDLPQDPESENALGNGGWQRFDKIVFVSHWQKQQYVNHYNIPFDKCTVLQNAITPFELEQVNKKPTDKIKLIYHTTPHRGLGLAYHAVDFLSQTHKDIEFNVYSSFKIYGWEERDKQFENLYKAIADHPNMVYHGTVSNEDVRNALAESHIFAYPSTWPETSCISLMEAMSAKLVCVHSSLAALPETAANWTYMYDFTEDNKNHMDLFASCLNSAIEQIRKKDESLESRLNSQKAYADLFYSWDLRQIQWAQFLDALGQQEPRPAKMLEDFEADEFTYKTA